MKIKVNLSDIAGTSAAPCVAVRNHFRYDKSTGHRSNDRDGTMYTILLLSQQADKMNVLVSDNSFAVTQEKLDEHTKTLDFVLVGFEGLEITPYAKANSTLYSARADGIQIVGTVGDNKKEEIEL